MPHRVSGFLDILIILFVFGILVPIGKALVTKEQETAALVIGRAIINAVFTMSSGLVLLYDPAAHPLGILALGALLSSVGMAGAERWAKWYLHRKLGPGKEQAE